MIGNVQCTGNVHEILPRDAPKTYGPMVTTTSYVDANLYHDQLTSHALTGVLHFVNGTPIDWYCKRQATVETARYSSEFVAAQIVTEHIIDLCATLRYLDVKIDGPGWSVRQPLDDVGLIWSVCQT